MVGTSTDRVRVNMEDNLTEWWRDEFNRASVYVYFILAIISSCLTGLHGEPWPMVVGLFWIPIFILIMMLTGFVVIFPLLYLGQFTIWAERKLINLWHRR